ncbi:MAG: carbon starvation protein A [Muribaculum sp.]|nr:carbon starvation protein A [Muribaculum sp.]
MITFLVALAILVGGYFVYGTLMDRIAGCDPSRKMPCYTHQDGVDYIPLPTWKVFLIQFLNIAGLGPIFGAIMGIMFGPSAFLWIVFGTILAGAVHDFLSGVISVRRDGASLPEIVGIELGTGIKQLMRAFSLLLMMLVGAVFILTPAGLIAGMTPDWMDAKFWIGAIFIYYMLATILPIDKLIGNIYPLFGFALLFMAVGIMCVLIFGNVPIPDDIMSGLHNRSALADSQPLFPMMFVSIACGAISGFHATQSPMMARCLKNEKLARPIFYGAMVAEGVVALIWAAAAIAFTGGYTELGTYLSENGGAGGLVHDISISWLGAFGGVLAIIGVIAAPITTGDTALRSARLIAADFMGIEQTKVLKRIILSLPIFAVTYFIMLTDFNVLWRYFAWCNQTLAMFTLWAITVYLARNGKAYAVTLLPAMFMTCVCITYILFAPEGLGFDYSLSVGAGILTALGLCAWFLKTYAFRRKVAIMED